MNGRRARVKCSRSRQQPDPQQRSVGLAPPPSLLHDSPVSSMEGRGQCDPPSHHHHPASYPERFTARQGVLLPTPNLPRLPCANPRNSRERWSNLRSPLSAPLGEVEAPTRVPGHHSRPTHPPATRAHRVPGPPV